MSGRFQATSTSIISWRRGGVRRAGTGPRGEQRTAPPARREPEAVGPAARPGGQPAARAQEIARGFNTLPRVPQRMSLTTTALFCLACNARLTNWLKPIRSARAARDHCKLNCNAGEAPVPVGLALMMEGEVLREYLGSRRNPPSNPAPQSWINLADISACVSRTKNAMRLSGCCGLDGLDGPNRVCRCGAEVGTEHSDCCTRHLFVAHPPTTYWITEPQD